MKCLIIDAVHSAIAEELSKYMQVDTHMLPTQEELLKLIPDYDVLIMRVDPAINKEILDAAKNLKVIGVCSVGLNHVDMDACQWDGHADGTAEGELPTAPPEDFDWARELGE